MEEQVEFGDWLRHELDERNLTISEAARRLGVSQGAVSNWVRALRRPDANSMRRLAEVLDIPIDRVIEAAARGENQPKQVTPVAPPRRIARRRFPRFHMQVTQAQGERAEDLLEMQAVFEMGLDTGIDIGTKHAYEDVRRILSLLRGMLKDEETETYVRPWLDLLSETFAAENDPVHEYSQES